MERTCQASHASRGQSLTRPTPAHACTCGDRWLLHAGPMCDAHGWDGWDTCDGRSIPAQKPSKVCSQSIPRRNPHRDSNIPGYIQPSAQSSVISARLLQRPPHTEALVVRSRWDHALSGRSVHINSVTFSLQDKLFRSSNETKAQDRW